MTLLLIIFFGVTILPLAVMAFVAMMWAGASVISKFCR